MDSDHGLDLTQVKNKRTLLEQRLKDAIKAGIELATNAPTAIHTYANHASAIEEMPDGMRALVFLIPTGEQIRFEMRREVWRNLGQMLDHAHPDDRAAQSASQEANTDA